MTSIRTPRRLAALTVSVALAAPAAALADPPKDSLPSAAAPTADHVKSYEMNPANGEHAPARKTPPRTESMGVAPIHSQIGPAGHTSAATQPQTDDGFAPDDAAAGASAALLLAGGVILIVRTTGRRGRSPAGVGSGS
jgi:hypothetical protein